MNDISNLEKEYNLDRIPEEKIPGILEHISTMSPSLTIGKPYIKSCGEYNHLEVRILFDTETSWKNYHEDINLLLDNNREFTEMGCGCKGKN